MIKTFFFIKILYNQCPLFIRLTLNVLSSAFLWMSYSEKVILSIVHTNILCHKNETENKQIDTDAFDLQKKMVEQSFCIFCLFKSLILSVDIVIYLSFVFFNDSLLK